MLFVRKERLLQYLLKLLIISMAGYIIIALYYKLHTANEPRLSATLRTAEGRVRKRKLPHRVENKALAYVLNKVNNKNISFLAKVGKGKIQHFINKIGKNINKAKKILDSKKNSQNLDDEKWNNTINFQSIVSRNKSETPVLDEPLVSHRNKKLTFNDTIHNLYNTPLNSNANFMSQESSVRKTLEKASNSAVKPVMLRHNGPMQGKVVENRAIVNDDLSPIKGKLLAPEEKVV